MGARKIPVQMESDAADLYIYVNHPCSFTERQSLCVRRLLEDGASKGSEVGGCNSKANDNGDAHVENDQGLEVDANSSFELFRDSEELADEYNYDYDDYVDEYLWGDEEWTEAHLTVVNYVDIDAHILCTTVIAGIDNDGVSKMIFDVSYFFGHERHVWVY